MVHMQTFVMIHNQQRVWSEPISGIYSSSNTSDFGRARLKLKCSFSMPENFKFVGKRLVNNHDTSSQELEAAQIKKEESIQ